MITEKYFSNFEFKGKNQLIIGNIKDDKYKSES